MSIGVISLLIVGMIGSFLLGGMFGFWVGAASEA